MRSILLLAPMLIVLFATTPLTLYDGSSTEGGRQLPAQQGNLQYGAQTLCFSNPPVQAKQQYDEQRKLTVLDTSGERCDAAGYGTALPAEQSLSRTAGFTLTFTIAIETEEHTNANRAGWSVLLLGDDAKGIELAFWKDQVWAQEGNARPFTHAETALLDTTTLREYELSIVGDVYVLKTGGSSVLGGAVRDYSDFQVPPGIPNPYRTPNFIFFGDNSSSALGTTAFAKAAITRGVGSPATPTPPTTTETSIFLPYVAR